MSLYYHWGVTLFLSSFLHLARKNAAKNLYCPLHCNGLMPIATKITPLRGYWLMIMRFKN